MKSIKAANKKQIKDQNNQTKIRNIPLVKDLEKNKKKIDQELGNGPNVFRRDLELKIKGNQKHQAFLIGIGGLVEEHTIRQQIIEPLLSNQFEKYNQLIHEIKNKAFVKDI